MNKTLTSGFRFKIGDTVKPKLYEVIYTVLSRTRIAGSPAYLVCAGGYDRIMFQSELRKQVVT